MKKSNPITKKTKATKIPNTQHSRLEVKSSPWLEDYMDLFSFKMKPITEAFIQRLASELNAWSQQEDSLILRDFYDNKNIPHDAFYRWVGKYPEMAYAHAIAKGRIGSRREKGGLTRKLDSSMVSSSMPMYDLEWKEMVEWKSKMKNESIDNTVKVVVIDKLSD